MGTGPYRRRKTHAGDKPMKEKYRTKRKTKDLDEIQDDLRPCKVQKVMSQPVDDDLAGGGQHYCIHCAKHCINERALKDHLKSKPHKKRVKALKETAHTQEDAERAAGMGSYIPPKPFNTDLPVMEVTEASSSAASTSTLNSTNSTANSTG